MSVILTKPWRTQPLLSVMVANNLPPPFLTMRPSGANFLATQGAQNIVSATYTNSSESVSGLGRGVKFGGAAGDGLQMPLGSAYDRNNYCVAITFKVLNNSANQTIFTWSGTTKPLQVRLNTSAQLEVINEGTALLLTTTYAGFTPGTTHTIIVRNANGNTGPLSIFRAGQIIATAAGNDAGGTSPTFWVDRRSSGTSETSDAIIGDIVVWCTNLPSEAQCAALTQDTSRLWQPMPRRIWAPAAAAGGSADGLIAASLSDVGVGASSVTATASIAGVLSDTGVGASIASADGSIAGVLSMVGVGTGSAISSAAGSIAGSASVEAVGSSVSAAVVSSAGVLNVQGVGAISSGIVAASGSIAASLSMTGVGASVSSADAQIAGTLSMVGAVPRSLRRAEGRKAKKPRAPNQDELDIIELSAILVPALCGGSLCL